MAASEGARKAAWFEKLTADLGERSQTEPFIPTLYYDNQGAVALVHDTKFHTRAKHIKIRYLYVRTEMVHKNRLKVVHIPGTEQVADIFIKQLGVVESRRHLKALGLDIE